MAGPGVTARAIFQAHVDNLYPESLPIDFQWSFVAAVGQLQTVTLNNGDNTLTIPAGTSVVGLKPPATNSVALKAKGAGGDTGWTLQAAMPNVFTWSAGNIVINAGGSSVAGVQLAFL